MHVPHTTVTGAQAGWKSPEASWRELPAEELTAVTQMLAIRDDVNQARLSRAHRRTLDNCGGHHLMLRCRPALRLIRVFARCTRCSP